MTGKDVFRSISGHLERVEKEIRIQADLIVESWRQDGCQGEHLDRAVRHLLEKPGKMLRPALVLLSAGMVGRAAVDFDSSLIKLATAVELIHSASLIHDDIIDDEQLRRGEIALHRLHGNHTAVLVGDVLYAQSFSLITDLRLPQWNRHLAIYRLFCDTTRNMCLGEIAEQRVMAGKISLSFPDYLHILKNKTAVLMSACCESGAILAGAGEEIAKKLARFGLAFGLAFQLLDDHNDRDALIQEPVDIVEKAIEQIVQARSILDDLGGGVYNRELTLACEILSRSVRVPGC
jgi:geranylgeranyl pyrophosphate synthase